MTVHEVAELEAHAYREKTPSYTLSDGSTLALTAVVHRSIQAWFRFRRTACTITFSSHKEPAKFVISFRPADLASACQFEGRDQASALLKAEDFLANTADRRLPKYRGTPR